jgi:phosphomevalonate kinase
MIASAPGKLIVTGEYAVLDGAPALVIAMNPRAVATRRKGPRGSSPFLVAVVEELERRLGPDHPATRAALEVVVDSSAFYAGGSKLGLGSSAAVTVAATALALATDPEGVPVAVPVIDRELVLSIATAAHANAQGARETRDSMGSVPSTRGSGADVAAAVHGGAIAFSRTQTERVAWPAGVTLIPFFTGVSANTVTFVREVGAARERDRAAVDAALAAIGQASRAACQACASRAPDIATNALLAALALAAEAMDRLAAATRLPLVPAAVTAARQAMARLGGTAKTTGAGGGDIAIAVIPGTEDVTVATHYLIEAGCPPLHLTLDPTGVDLQPDAQ